MHEFGRIVMGICHASYPAEPGAAESASAHSAGTGFMTVGMLFY